MPPKERKMMELAMIISIPFFAKEIVTPGRLKNLYDRLEKVCTKELQKIPAATKKEVADIEARVFEFGRKTGWEGKKRHIVTLASFCLGMIDASDFIYDPAITETLNDIVDYFERAKKAPGPSFWAGTVAAQKWLEVMDNA